MYQYSHVSTILCNAHCDMAAHAVNITLYIIPPQTKTEPPPKRSCSMTHASQNAFPVGMAKVKPTFIRKQNQIAISRSEVQMTVAPIPPCHSMTPGELFVSTDFWQSVDEYYTVFRLLLQSDSCYVGAARWYSHHQQQRSHVAYLYVDGRQRFLWQGIISIKAR